MRVFLYAFASQRGVPQLQLFYDDLPSGLQLRALPPVLHRWELTGTRREARSLTELEAEFHRLWTAGQLPPDNVARK